ncbi:MAG: AAA family ATPase [Hadesarchaea archaeon]|nr:AAA family ATPase [Hadesarchaea archaeon]
MATEEQRRFVEEARFEPASLERLRGLPSVRAKLERLIGMLRRYQELSRECRLPAGALFCGPPGMGKTLSARILATESGALLVDATLFPRSEEGWSPNDVVSLFSLAREAYRRKGRVVLLHFEEISDLCGADGEEGREVRTALLSELDGMGGRAEGIFVVACTNRPPCSLPYSLQRPGRLSEVVEFAIDRQGQREVLEYYLARKPVEEGVDPELLSSALPSDLSPAAIEEVVEGAHYQALLEGRREIGKGHLISSLLPRILGSVQGAWSSQQERWVACVHEAGHAAVARALGVGVRLVVVPREHYRRGITLLDYGPGPHPRGSNELRMCIGLAGKAAEELVFGEPTLDEPLDVGWVTKLSLDHFAKHSPDTNYCTLDLAIELDPLDPDFSVLRPAPEAERAEIYSRARQLRASCLERARRILQEVGGEGVEGLARELWEREFLFGGEVEGILSPWLARRAPEETPRTPPLPPPIPGAQAPRSSYR